MRLDITVGAHYPCDMHTQEGSEGARRLRKLIERIGGSNEVMRMLGASTGVVSHWANGDRCPSRFWANKIAAVFPEIPATCWDDPPAAVETATTKTGTDDGR